MYTSYILNCLVGKYLNLGVSRDFTDDLISHFVFGEIEMFVCVCSLNKNFLSADARHCVGWILEGYDMPHELVLPASSSSSYDYSVS